MTIDPRAIARQLGLLMFVLAALLSLVALYAFLDYAFGAGRELHVPAAMLLSAAGAALIGGILYAVGKTALRQISNRDALLLVGLSWILGALISALPYRAWSELRADAALHPHPFDSFVNCYFEAMSGLTTTGATVVTAIGTLPKSLLLWRAVTHWIGGLGIVVLFVAFLPMIGAGSRRLFRGEVPGPSKDAVTPRIQDTARVLWLIYTGISVCGIVSLRLAGMSWFEAVCHTFAAISGGGFSTEDGSLGAFPKAVIQYAAIGIMFAGAVDFSLYHAALEGKWRKVFSNPQLRAYVLIMLIAFGLVSILRVASEVPAPNQARGLGDTLRDVAFQVVSIQTTTGFVSADFDAWDQVSKAILVCLMFINGCGGSCSGGIKVIRWVVLVKILGASLERIFRPAVVRTVRIGRTAIDADLKLETLAFFVWYGLIFAVATILLMFIESGNGIDPTTAFTAIAATFNNVGPGLARVGATQNYEWFSDLGKIVLCLVMVLGRLEMFTILALLTPRFWRGE